MRMSESGCDEEALAVQSVCGSESEVKGGKAGRRSRCYQAHE